MKRKAKKIRKKAMSALLCIYSQKGGSKTCKYASQLMYVFDYE